MIDALSKKFAALPAEKARERKKRRGTIGIWVRCSQITKATTSSPSHEGPYDLNAAPARAITAYQPPHEPEGRACHDQHTAEVKHGAWPEAFLNADESKRHDDQADRDIEPEDPLPGQTLSDGSTYDWARDEGQPRQTPKDAQRPRSLRRLERRAQQRQGQRRHQRGASALDGARGDQPADVRRERACC